MSENQEKTTTIAKNNPVIDYVEKHNSVVTLLIIPVIGIIVSMMLYSYYHGMYNYFNISEIWLDMSSDHSKFYPLFMISIGILILVFNVFPFLLIRYNEPKEYSIENKPVWLPKFLVKNPRKLFGGVFKSIVIGIVFYAFLFLLFCLAFFDIKQGALQGFLIWMIFYGIGLIEGIASYKGSKHKIKEQEYNEKTRERDIIIGVVIIIVCIILEFLLCYWTGHSIAQNKKEFKIIGNSTVILHETQDKFIVAEAEINGDILNIKPKQTIIENTDVTYEIKTFAKVNPPKS